MVRFIYFFLKLLKHQFGVELFNLKKRKDNWSILYWETSSLVVFEKNLIKNQYLPTFLRIKQNQRLIKYRKMSLLVFIYQLEQCNSVIKFMTSVSFLSIYKKQT